MALVTMFQTVRWILRTAAVRTQTTAWLLWRRVMIGLMDYLITIY